MIHQTSTDPKSYIDSLTKEEIRSYIAQHNVKNYDVNYLGLKPTMLIIWEDLNKAYVDDLVARGYWSRAELSSMPNWSVLD
jgi:hypothetical protein